MHNVTVPLTDKLKQSVDMNAQARVIAEWNHNRYSAISSVTNGTNPSASEYDVEAFPVSSIVEPQRPTRGIVKALAGPVAGADGRTIGSYADLVNGTRYVTSSDDDIYKYWTSPGESAAGSPFAITNVSPQVIYAANVWSNKIRIGLENFYASPSTYTVWVTTDGTNWTQVSSNPTIQSNGVIELYRQGDGSWSTTVNRDNPTNLRGVRLVVTNMNAGSVRCNVIEVGARLEADLSEYVIEYSTDLTMSDVSFLAPIGKASANEASVTLDNTANIFNNSNPSSPYYKLLEKNVRVTIDIGINKGTMASPNIEWVRQFTGHSMGWNGQERDGTTLELTDFSEYLQSVNPRSGFYQNVSAAEAIWRLLDSVGFSSWSYQPLDIDPTMLIPAFWFTDEKTVWAIIQEIAEVTQTAVYFDEYGVLQILPRSRALNLTNTPVWQFDAVTDGSKLADIIKAPVTQDFEANHVDIEYTPTAQSDESESGLRPMEIVWEPEDTVVLRSSQMVKNMSAVATDMWITPAEAKVWPYTAVVQVEGEFMRYTAKEYSYHDASNVLQKKYIKTEEERVALDKLSATKSYSNAFTGRLEVLAANRGMWGTLAMLHDITYSNWTLKRYRHGSGAIRSWSGGFLPNVNESTLRLKTNSTFTTNSWYACTVGSSSDPLQPYYFGTRLRYDTSGDVHGSAGIVIGAGTNDSGYYIEVRRTAVVTESDRAKIANEISVTWKDQNGVLTRLNKGAVRGIASGVWYDLDVKYTPGTNSRQFDILINGVPTLTAVHNSTIPSDNKGNRQGVYVRGNTSCQFEYFYTFREPDNPSWDDAAWWDRIKGGYQSNQYDAEWSYGRYSLVKLGRRASVKVPEKASKKYMDDFGPIVHEVREYDVKFNIAPVTHSMLYFSNESQVICTDYNSNAFGAKFTVANLSRDNAVLKGEDTLTFGSDNPVEQRFLIYGRNFIEKESRKYTVKDDGAIKRRGKIETQVASKWIQSEDAAKKLGEWILSHWAGGSDQVTLESFGNPVLQIGDLVTINFPNQNMAPATHKYFIVGISQSFDGGLVSTFTLRRMKI